MSGFLADLRRGWEESTAPLRQRWLLLAPPEQRALRILGIFLLVVGLVYGIWLPSLHAAQAARQGYEHGRDLRLRMDAVAAQLAGNPAAAGGSVLGLASSQAAAQGLTLSRIEPDSDALARVWVEKVDFNVVAGWLDKLAAQGVRLQEVQVEKQGDGGVSGRFVLAR
jgi:type II secretory pathway component PulM